MPAFDLRGITVAKYVNNNGTVTYTNKQSAGDAMNAALELRFAEGRLYAESALAEYIRKAVGGTISLGTKYIPDGAKKLMFGMTEKTRTVTYTEGTTEITKTVTSMQLGAMSQSSYVGLGFYAPDMVDGVEKFTAVFAAKVLFGPPPKTFQTSGENVNFQTDVTQGEFLPSDAADKLMLDYAVCDSEEEAIAWRDACLSAS